MRKKILTVALMLVLAAVSAAIFFNLNNTEKIKQDMDVSLSELSAIDEIIYRFDQSDSIPAYTLIDKSRIWWNDDDGYSIIIPSTKSIFIPKPDKGCLDRGLVPSIFNEELAISKDVFERKGFVLNSNNSSIDASDNNFYDYVQTYRKDDEICALVVNSDCSSYQGSGFELAHSIFISCGNALKEAQAARMPYLGFLRQYP